MRKRFEKRLRFSSITERSIERFQNYPNKRSGRKELGRLLSWDIHYLTDNKMNCRKSWKKHRKIQYR